MSKHREDRIYEIYEDLSKNKNLYKIYLQKLEKVKDTNTTEDYFYKIERCYLKAKREYEGI